MKCICAILLILASCNTHDVTEQPPIQDTIVAAKRDTAIILPSRDTTKVSGKELKIDRPPMQGAAWNYLTEVNWKPNTGQTYTSTKSGSISTIGLTLTKAAIPDIDILNKKQSDSILRLGRQIDTLKKSVSALSAQITNAGSGAASQTSLVRFKVVSSNEIRFWNSKGDSSRIMFETVPK